MAEGSARVAPNPMPEINNQNPVGCGVARTQKKDADEGTGC